MEGWKVNRKRVERIWREEGLAVRKKQHKKKRLSTGKGGCMHLKAEYENHVWSYDFVHDRLSNGKKIRVLTVIDEYSRKCLSLKDNYRLGSNNVIQELSNLFVNIGLPKYIRSDNGGEFIANILRKWLQELKVETSYIDPGAPWQNGYNESFNGKFRINFWI